MFRTQLKSKIHLAAVTDANLGYEGSITIPQDVLDQVDLWPGEKVLVVVRDNGERFETYVQPGAPGSAAFIVNGSAARRVQVGDRITIMAFGLSEKPIRAQKVLCDERNRVVQRSEGYELVTQPRVVPLR